MESITVQSELVQRKGEKYLVALMPSESDPAVTYRTDVTNGRCSCPSWKFSKVGANGKKRPCKHLRALGYVETGEGQTKKVESSAVGNPAWFSQYL